MNIAKFLRTRILKNICELLFLWLGFTNVILNVACVLFVIEKQRIVYWSTFFVFLVICFFIFCFTSQYVFYLGNIPSLKAENYCISRRHRLRDQTNKQPLSNFEPPKSWKYKQLWGLKPDPSCLQKKLYFYWQVSIDLFPSIWY